MSTLVKWIIALLVIAALAWLLWWGGWLNAPKPAPVDTGAAVATTTEPVADAPINGMSANNDASDTAIAQDTVAIDAQMKAYTTDSSDVDSSMQDKQVTQ